MAGIKVTPVENRSDMKRFVDFPWEVYRGDLNWIPPLKREVHRLLNIRKHPFWKFSERTLFLAERGSQVIGRIAGIIDGNYNAQYHEKMGAWGFFECMDDQEAAEALFSSVEGWAVRKGMAFLRGPLSPSLNYEAGTLIRNFSYPPTLLMTYNPPYYIRLITESGFKKENDLLSFWVDRNLRIPDWVIPLVERMRKKKGLWVRPSNPKDFRSELALIWNLYNACWSQNWGHVPPSQDEANEMGRNLNRIIDPDLVFFVYYKTEPVGVGFALPDWNTVLKRLNGRIGPLDLLKIPKYKKEIHGLRGFMFGVREEYRQLGFPIAAFDYMNRLLRQQNRYQYMELGWTLEDNDAINQFFREGGLEVYRKYRIFRKDLSP